MARREFVALGFDPAPGDPTALADAAERTAGAARAFGSAAERVARLSTAGWLGEAGNAFRGRLGPLPGDLDHASRAHHVTAQALTDFGAGLGARQRRADELERGAAVAKAREAAAIGEVNRLAGMVAPTGSADLADLRARFGAARTTAETARDDVDAIVREARRLLADHDAAAAGAARSIRAASDAPYQRPGRLRRALDRAKQWIRDHEDLLAGISTILKGVSAVLGVISLVPGLQFLAPLAIAAGALALALDTAIKLATGRGSWTSLILDAALTVLPTGRVARGLKSIREVELALAATNRAIPPRVKGVVFRAARNLPEGMTRAQMDRARQLIRAGAGRYGDDVIVQGSRAKYTVHHRSDIDIGLRVSPEEFARIHRERFSVNVGTPVERTAMANSMTKGIVHANRAGMKDLREDLAAVFDLDKVDISVIRRGGEFDEEPWLRL